MEKGFGMGSSLVGTLVLSMGLFFSQILVAQTVANEKEGLAIALAPAETEASWKSLGDAFIKAWSQRGGSNRAVWLGRSFESQVAMKNAAEAVKAQLLLQANTEGESLGIAYEFLFSQKGSLTYMPQLFLGLEKGVIYGDSQKALQWFSLLQAMLYEEYDAAKSQIMALGKPDSLQHRLCQTYIAFGQADYDQVMSLCRDLLQTQPGYGPAHYLRAKVHLEKKTYAMALVEINKAREALGDNAWTLAALGEAMAFGYQPESPNDSAAGIREARGYLDRSIQLHPEGDRAYFHRFMLLAFLGEPEPALRDINRYLELRPKSATGYYFRAGFYDQLRKRDAAKADLDRAIQIDNAFAPAYLLRGKIALRNQDFEAAVRDFSQTLSLEPGEMDAYSGRGEAYSSMSLHDKAIQDYSVRLGKEPRHYESLLGRGISYAQKGEAERALTDMNLMVTLYGDRPSALYTRANFLINLKQLPEAINDYQALLKLKPDHQDARFNLSLALGQSKRLDEALAELEHLLDADPQHLKGRLLRGKLHLQRNNLALAKDDFLAILAADEGGTSQEAIQARKALDEISR